MPQHSVLPLRKRKLPGLDSAATPLLGLGLGLTGLLLRLRPRLAAWPLALTAAAALLYRDPRRTTPALPSALFAPADGTLLAVEELYEHRFLHTDALRIAIAAAPFDLPIYRSPVAGSIAYLEHVPGAYGPTWDLRAAEQNERLDIGIKSAWGPLMLQVIAGPLARRLACQVALGQPVRPGARLGAARFGARVDLLLPCDLAEQLPPIGSRVLGGLTPIGQLAPL